MPKGDDVSGCISADWCILGNHRVLLALTPTLILAAERGFIKSTENVIHLYSYYICYKDLNPNMELQGEEKIEIDSSDHKNKRNSKHVLNSKKYIWVLYF